MCSSLMNGKINFNVLPKEYEYGTEEFYIDELGRIDCRIVINYLTSASTKRKGFLVEIKGEELTYWDVERIDVFRDLYNRYTIAPRRDRKIDELLDE